MSNEKDIPIKYKQFTYKEATVTANKLKNCRERMNISRGALEYRCTNNLMPSCANSIISFEQCVRPGQKRQNVTGMRLATFYELCEYYKVSADYLLGFKESRHRESSADYAKSEFGLDDDVLQLLKQMTNHEKLSLSTKYKSFKEIDFFKLFITNFVKNFEAPILEYFNKLSELDDFKDKNIVLKTDMLNNNGSLHLTKKEQKNEELFTADIVEDTRLTDEFQDLEFEVQLAKFEVIKNFEVFLSKLKEHLMK